MQSRHDDDRWRASKFRDKLLRRIISRSCTYESASAYLDEFLRDPRVMRAGDPWQRLEDGIVDGSLFLIPPAMEYDRLSRAQRTWLDRAVRLSDGVDEALLKRTGISKACAMYAARLADLGG
jgi:hypothetical protein